MTIAIIVALGVALGLVIYDDLRVRRHRAGLLRQARAGWDFARETAHEFAATNKAQRLQLLDELGAAVVERNEAQERAHRLFAKCAFAVDVAHKAADKAHAALAARAVETTP